MTPNTGKKAIIIIQLIVVQWAKLMFTQMHFGSMLIGERGSERECSVQY